MLINIDWSKSQLLSTSKNTNVNVNVPFPLVPTVSVNTGSTSVNLNNGAATSSGVLASSTNGALPSSNVAISHEVIPGGTSHQAGVSVQGNGLISLLTNFGLAALQSKLNSPVEFLENKRSILEVAATVLRAQVLAQRQATPIYTFTKASPPTGFVVSHTLNIHKQI